MNVKHRPLPETTELPPAATPAGDGGRVPVKAADVPGLGPIRVRALVKAGYGAAVALRAATLEQLIAVPGMSEIKARHILTYLEQFTEGELQAAADAARQAELPAEQLDMNVAQGDASSDMKAAFAFTTVPSPLDEPAQQALHMAMRLLMTEPATGYRARLLREIIGFMRLVVLLLQCGPLSAKAEERGRRRLKGALEALSEAVARPELDRKEQTRLADQLAQIRERIEALAGQTLRHAPGEADDE